MNENTSSFPHDALEACLAVRATGITQDSLLLGLYPTIAAELSLALAGADLAARLSPDDTPVPADAFQRSRTRLLGQAARLRDGQARRKRFFGGLNRLAWTTLLLVAAIVMSGYGFYNVAAQALPGEQLYPVKRTLESMRLQLASPEMRSVLEETYKHRRLDEVQALVSARSAGQHVSFWGVVEEQNNTRWVVDSIPVHLAADVLIVGQIEPGVMIEVEGQTTSEGWVLASELHLNRRDWVGDVERITPTEWIVSGLTFQVNESTSFDGTPDVGNPVLVTMQAEEDGRMLAMRIIRLVPLDASQTPTTVPTPLPTYTPTPAGPTSRLETPAQQTTKAPQPVQGVSVEVSASASSQAESVLGKDDGEHEHHEADHSHESPEHAEENG
ncbi:MAG: hypothetical protein Fur0018_01810 [Anaerolineales bacterium]